MSEGIIVGGWPYVVAAYLITTAGLLGYVWSLARRRKQLDSEE